MRWAALFVILLSVSLTGRAAEPLGEPENEDLAIATFAGGCFWCIEHAYDLVDGVVDTISGYTAGDKADPTYREVSSGSTGHAEAVRIVYDPDEVDYEHLLYVFWRNIDPMVDDRQFCDTGSQYRSGIYYHTPEQKRLAEETRDELEASGRLPGPILTEIEPAGPFWKAEKYHQDYATKNPMRYTFYYKACGRADRLEELWGDEAEAS